MQAGNNSGAYAPGGYSQQGVNKGQDSFVQPASYIQQGGYAAGDRDRLQAAMRRDRLRAAIPDSMAEITDRVPMGRMPDRE